MKSAKRPQRLSSAFFFYTLESGDWLQLVVVDWLQLQHNLLSAYYMPTLSQAQGKQL